MYLVRFLDDIGELAKKGELKELTNERTRSLKVRNKISIVTYLGDAWDLKRLRG